MIRIIYIIPFLLCACTTSRVMFWNFASQKDMARFPSHAIEAPKETFEFVDDSLSNSLKVDAYGKHGLSAVALDDFLSSMEAHRAFLIIKNDSIIYEHYGGGVDRDTPLTYFSVSKSIISMLVGIASEEGLLDPEKDYVIQYLPELKSIEGFQGITLAHLLTHTSGIRFRESYANPFSNDVARIYYSKNLDRVLKKIKIESKPGTRFHYSSINTQLLGLILMKVTDESISSYFEEKIWQHIGAQHDASWSVYEKDGIEKTFCCFNATSIDMAKLARLALNKGEWNGVELIPASWFDKSLKRNAEDGSIWGYQWHWILGLREYQDYMAQGLYNQYLYMMPKKDIIIVMANDFHNPKTNWPHLFRQIVDQL